MILFHFRPAAAANLFVWQQILLKLKLNALVLKPEITLVCDFSMINKHGLRSKDLEGAVTLAF